MRKVIRILDIALVALTAPLIFLFLFRRRTQRLPFCKDTRSLLQFDMAFTHSMIRARSLEASYTAVQLDGYFNRVWSVHPFSSVADDSKSLSSGPTQEFPLTEQVSVIEAKVGRFAVLRNFQFLNFVLSQMGLLRYLDHQFAKFGLAAIKCGDPYYLGLFGLALGWAYRVPVIVRIGGNYDRVYQDTGQAAMPKLFRHRKIEVWIQKFVLARVSHVVAPVKDYVEFAVRNGAPAERCTVLPYGNLISPLHFAEPASRVGGKSVLASEFPEIFRAPIAICISRLETVKMPDHAVKAIYELKKRGSVCNLLLIGDGILRDDLERLVQELGIADQVYFAGNRGQDWMSQILPQTNFVVSPLTGRALTESALSGRPLIGYDLDWQSEIIITGKTGILVPARQVEKLAEAVLDLMADPKKAKALGDNARELAMDMMDPARINRREVELLESLRSQPRD